MKKQKTLSDYSVPLGREISNLQKTDEFKGIDALMVFPNGSIFGRRVKRRTLFGNAIFEYVQIDYNNLALGHGAKPKKDREE